MGRFAAASPGRHGHRRGQPMALLAVAVTGSVAAVLAVAVIGPADAGASTPLVGAGSNRCLDVPGGATANGTQLTIYACNGGANQAFTTTSAGQLQVRGKCLDGAAGADTPGDKVQLYACNGGANQRWTRTSAGAMTNAAHGLCLDVVNAGTADGAPVQLWNCNGGANQRWAPTAGTTTPQPPTPTGGGPCAVNPVDRAATPQAKKLLCYIYSQYGNHIISGQQESTWVGGPDYEMNYIHQHTGKYPVIRGMDRGDSPSFGARALSWWNSGGIPMIGYHMGSPSQGADGYAGSQLSANITAAVTPGTPDYGRLTQRLDGLAAQLKVVQDGGGAVLFRPWHEAGGTWFWWSKEGGAQYNRLWQFTFSYLTRTKGLHNLVWLHPYNGTPQKSFYPSGATVDVTGADTYAGNYGPQTGLFNSTRSIVGSSLPIALHENGPIPDPDQLRSAGTRWVLFNTWHTTWLTDTSKNSLAQLRKTYTSAYVVTRDEVPSLR